MYEIEFYDNHVNLICRHFFTSWSVKAAKRYAEKVVSSWPDVKFALVFNKFTNSSMFRCFVN